MLRYLGLWDNTGRIDTAFCFDIFFLAYCFALCLFTQFWCFFPLMMEQLGHLDLHFGIYFGFDV